MPLTVLRIHISLHLLPVLEPIPPLVPALWPSSSTSVSMKLVPSSPVMRSVQCFLLALLCRVLIRRFQWPGTLGTDYIWPSSSSIDVMPSSLEYSINLSNSELFSILSGKDSIPFVWHSSWSAWAHLPQVSLAPSTRNIFRNSNPWVHESTLHDRIIVIYLAPRFRSLLILLEKELMLFWIVSAINLDASESVSD